MINTALLALAIISFYLLATVLLAIRWRRTTAAAGGGVLLPAGIALLLHALLLTRLVITPAGVNFGFSNSLTLFTWLITCVALAVGWRASLHYLGLLLFPANAVTVVVALVFPPPAAAEKLSLALEAHVLIAILAYCLLSTAALLALVLAVQDHQLHHHKQGALLRHLPPLQTTEHLLFRLIEAGFVLLSFTVVSGFMFADDLFTHKIVFSVIAWAVFLGLLLGRRLAGWRGQIAIRWTLGGALALLLAFFGTKLVMEFILVP